MTNRHRTKEELEKARGERLAYVGALAAGLVHEVRTPLHAIQMNAQILCEDADLLPVEVRGKFERRTKRIYTEVKALTKTLDAFLTFARPPRLDPTPTDFNRFLRELIEFIEPEMDNAGIRLEVNLAPDMYPVILDHNQFSHAVLNLLRNARESIEQRQDKEPEAIEGWVRIVTWEDEGQVFLEVEDNGVGVKPEEEQEIFEVFYTTKEKGTGLGLGIVRRTVEDHRGSIALVSTPPPGAKFVVTLPRGRFLEFQTS